MRQGTPQETYDLCMLCWQAGKDGLPMPQAAKDQPDADVYDALRMHYCLGADGCEWDEEAMRDEAGLGHTRRPAVASGDDEELGMGESRRERGPS